MPCTTCFFHMFAGMITGHNSMLSGQHSAWLWLTGCSSVFVNLLLVSAICVLVDALLTVTARYSNLDVPPVSLGVAS